MNQRINKNGIFLLGKYVVCKKKIKKHFAEKNFFYSALLVMES